MNDRIGILAAAALAALFAVPAAAQQVTMMTGPQGGSWIPLGGALKSMWEAAIPGLADPAAARRRHRQRARHRRRQGADRLRQLVDDRRRHRGPRAVSEEGHQGLPGREPLSAVLPGRRAGGREDEFVRRLQGQDAGHAAEGQHRGNPDRRGAQAQRHDLPVARQGELPGVLHRRGGHDEGRPRAGVHARHHGAGVGGHGPRQRARHHAGAGRRQDDERAEATRIPATTSSSSRPAPIRSRTRTCPRSATRRTSSPPAICPRTSFTR